jgi:hypothetical protein
VIVGTVEVDAEGKITVTAARPASEPQDEGKRALDAWRAKRARENQERGQ